MRKLKKMIVFIIVVVLLIVISGYFFMRQPQFGKLPTGERLEKIKSSPHYKDGSFQNIHETPSFTEGATFFSVMREFFFGKSKRSMPLDSLPSKKIDLFSLDTSKNVLVWFGHSSYFMQVDGKKILVDPVLSGSASPVKFTTKSFKGSDVYTTDDIPEIDFLFITHDHWDHLDYETILKLQPKIKKIITGLGVGAHLEHWGIKTSLIEERDWQETITLEDGFVAYSTPARHFSGRGFTRNKSLWMSFVLVTPTQKIYIGGDSGYDDHFKEIGEKFGPIDIAILENGQYNKSWKYIHMMPEEAVQAAIDLKAKKLFPVHWSKFSLALHDWDEPIIKIADAAEQRQVSLVLPMIGETVDLDSTLNYVRWWRDLK